MSDASKYAITSLNRSKSQVRKAADVVEQLATNLPKMDGRPTYLINASAVIKDVETVDVTDLLEDRLGTQATYVYPLSYDDGYPTIDGLPIWGRLPHEPNEVYNLYDEYKRLGNCTTQRVLAKLAEKTGRPISELNAIKSAYQWNTRLSALDAYTTMARAQMLEQCQHEIMGKHFSVAETLLQKGLDVLEHYADVITPNQAIKLIEIGASMGRIAVGLDPKTGERNNSKYSGPAGDGNTNMVQVNVSTGTSSPANVAPASVTNVGQEDRDRLSQILNVLQNTGVVAKAMSPEEIIDVEVEEDE